MEGCVSGLDQVGARLQRRPSGRSNRYRAKPKAQALWGAHDHFGGERLHTRPLYGRGSDSGQRGARRGAGDWPGEGLGGGVIRARGGRRRVAGPPPSWPTITSEVGMLFGPNERLFVRLICRSCPVGT